MVAAMVLSREIEGQFIAQRGDDGYFHATSLCAAGGKKWADYHRLDATKAFIQSLSQSVGIPIDSILEQKSGRGGGTWVHPRLAIHLGMWISPDFANLVIGWAYEIMSGQMPTVEQPATDHSPQLLAAFERQAAIIDRQSAMMERQAAVLELLARRFSQPAPIVARSGGVALGGPRPRMTDAVGQFVAERCIIADGTHIAFRVLFAAWRKWAKAKGLGKRASSPQAFGGWVRKAGGQQVKSIGGPGGSTVCTGITLRNGQLTFDGPT